MNRALYPQEILDAYDYFICPTKQIPPVVKRALGHDLIPWNCQVCGDYLYYRPSRCPACGRTGFTTPSRTPSDQELEALGAATLAIEARRIERQRQPPKPATWRPLQVF